MVRKGTSTTLVLATFPLTDRIIHLPIYFSMSLRIFILGLTASFGIAWLAVVIVPYYKMRNLEPVVLNEATDGAAGIFFPKREGRIANGARVYAENGCYQCHTQLVRPTYAGNDLFRTDAGGLKADPDRGDTRRETNAFDYLGESFAQIGLTRVGPDLSNVGRRVATYVDPYGVPVNAEQWLFQHLYRPRSQPENFGSVCPPHPYLFKKVDAKGTAPSSAIPADALFCKLNGAGTAVVPTDDARALVSYLLSMKKDQPVPAVLNFGPPAQEKPKKP